MNFLRSNNAAGQGVELRNGNLCAIFFLITFCGIQLLTVQKASSQVVWVDLGGFELGYELSTSGSFLSPWEQFDIKLYGDVPLAEDAIGLRFDLVLASEVTVETNGAVSLPGTSWLGNDDELTTGYNQNGAIEEVEVYRTDENIRSGQGWVANLHCEVGANGIQTNQVVTTLGGITILAENMDMRLTSGTNQGSPIQHGSHTTDTDHPVSAPQKELDLLSRVEEVKVFPNPCMDYFQLSGHAGKSMEIMLYNMEQKLVMHKEVAPGGKIDVRNLPPGIYYLNIGSTENVKPQVIKLVKR